MRDFEGMTIRQAYETLTGFLGEKGWEFDHYCPVKDCDYWRVSALAVEPPLGNGDRPFPSDNRIMCYMVEGGSEGWYVHVDYSHVKDYEQLHDCLMLAKFWKPETAARFAVDLSLIFYGK